MNHDQPPSLQPRHATARNQERATDGALVARFSELLGKQKEPAVLPDVQEQSQCSVAGVELKEGQTSPPKHFTEDLLLHAMETSRRPSGLRKTIN